MRNEADDFTADGAKAGGTAADGTGFVGVDVPGAIEALRQPSFIQSLGAQTINATGNLKFPRISTPSAATNKVETTAAAGSGLAMDEVTLNPNRATAETKYSKQLLIQGGAQVDAVIANDLRQALATHIDLKGFAEILADGSVDDQSTAGGTDTTYAATVAIAQEAAVLAAGGDLNGSVYVASPTAYKLAKSLALVNNISFHRERSPERIPALRNQAHRGRNRRKRGTANLRQLPPRIDHRALRRFGHPRGSIHRRKHRSGEAPRQPLLRRSSAPAWCIQHRNRPRIRTAAG